MGRPVIVLYFILITSFLFSCVNLDKEDIPRAPRAMINLETWLPSNYQVEGRGWKVKDVGSLGPGGR